MAPEHTAVRVALWRALHLLVDPAPPVFVDEVGARLVGEEGWRDRADMDPAFSKPMRASIVGRARFVEDLLEERLAGGLSQYVILGAGLDSLSQRRPELAAKLDIFEVDQPGPQAWKRKRLEELGMPPAKGLHFVPVDFETNESWWDRLLQAGFDPRRPSFFVSTGVSLYLTKETNRSTFERLSTLAPGSVFATTFMLSLDLLEGKERGIMEFVMQRAAEAGTPFLSLFSPEEILGMAREAGFKKAAVVSADEIFQKYFAHRADGLSAGKAEAFLVAQS